jgi:hypothetical protein
MSRANPRFRRINAPLPLVGASNGVVEFVFKGSIEGQQTINTFYYSGAVPAPTQGQLTTLSNNILTNLTTTYKAMLSADWLGNSSILNVVHRNDIMGIVGFSILAAPGTGPAGHEPTTVAGLIIRRSGVKGQHGRGRVSIPAVPTGWVTASQLTLAAGLTAYNNFETAMALTASDGTNTWTPCIAQRAAASPRLVIGFAPVVSVTTNPLLGTIRRRRLGRGV